ncbi:MAG: hypothetical protein MI892_07815 [Desulfobacterales bacterium]|nr:hypothetical protein [Desulfobacterales bacterium]
MGQTKKPIVYWVLQDNQVTPNMIDFLELIKLRVKELIKLKFIIPDMAKQTLELAAKLNPTTFKNSSKSKKSTYEGFCRKRDQLGNNDFSDGLKFWQTLLLDDLGSGNLYQAFIHAPSEQNVAGIVLQIPTPLGSGEAEERIFYAWVHLAKMNKVPIIGYELLPLATRWSLAPSIMDAVITTRKESQEYLIGPQANLTQKIWRIPRYEAKFFSPVTHPLFRNGMGLRYQHHNIPAEKTIVYLPHNVAMSYEYKNLIRHLLPFADQLHLMFSYGKDQIRGSHNHQQTIETISRNELPQFTYSFHDVNRPVEIIMADAVIACSDCYCAEISSVVGVPTIIYDPMMPPKTEGYKTWTNDAHVLKNCVKDIIDTHMNETELSLILLDIAKRNLSSGPHSTKGVANG